MIVIDASVVSKLVLPLEKGHEQVKEIFKQHKDKVEQILSVDFIFYEIANTLTTKSAIPQQMVTRSLSVIYGAEIEIYHPNEGDVKLAARLARKYKTSVYDMLYAVVAKNHKAKLITADEQFVKQTGFKFVQLLHRS